MIQGQILVRYASQLTFINLLIHTNNYNKSQNQVMLLVQLIGPGISLRLK